MRYMIKGGIWKNAEDEVLKAAVMKYGLNQWSRISSLLVRKSAKECKARWYEWLDPSIKKTEWTREEEEKLLHLAKIFPCQWRTISPMLQRTPAQCVEHYEKLLDHAQGKDEPDENDPRRLRPGEIDPNPETKPARPDEVDMDEDVKEMLQEARARLANTRGKKAKRKAREKILEEARRLANLQKKRELKAAGIDFEIPQRRKIRMMDYNIEIPFRRTVPEGRFKASKEEEPEPDPFKSAIDLQQIEGKRRDEEQEKFKEIDQRRINKLKNKDLPKAMSIIEQMNKTTSIHKRELVLPEAQVSDAELLAISKMTAQAGSLQSSGATQTLLGNFVQREMTPLIGRTPMREDTVLREAQNAVIMRNTETPLVGGKNTQLHSSHLPLDNSSTPFAQPAKPLVSKIPSTFVERIRTQQRAESVFGPSKNESTTLQSDEAWDTSKQITEPQPNFLERLEKLPEPKNDFQIDVPEIQSEEEEKIQPDMEEIESLQLREQKKQEEIEEQKISLAIRKKLPRPFIINPEISEAFPDKIIEEEMWNRITYDNYTFPGKFIQKPKEVPNIEDFSIEQLEFAKSLIQEEMPEDTMPISEFYNLCESHKNDYLYFPDTKSYEKPSEKSTTSIIESKKKTLAKYKAHFERMHNQIKKEEDSIEALFSSHKSTESTINEKISKLSNIVDDLKIKKTVFQTLQKQELNTMEKREAELQEYLSSLEDINAKLHKKHDSLYLNFNTKILQ